MPLTRAFTIGGLVVLATIAAATAPAVLRRDDAGRGTHETVVQPTRDTYVSEAKPDESYGTAQQLRSDNGPQTVRAYLHFDVPAVRGHLKAMLLRLHANAPDPTGLFVAPVAAVPWPEEMTWRTAVPVGDPAAQGHPVGADRWVDIDIRSLFRGPGPLDLALINPGETMVNYSSRESGPNTAPCLVLVTDG
jgi:hypothetical protein